MFDLSGRIALVTGVGPNIGSAIAASLARAGAVVLCNHRRAEMADAAAQRTAAEGKAFPLVFDVTDPDGVEDGVERAWRAHGPIDILVNNASITAVRSLLTVSVAEWRDVTRTVQEGTFLCSRAVARRLVSAQKPGAIINVAATSGHRGRK